MSSIVARVSPPAPSLSSYLNVIGLGNQVSTRVATPALQRRRSALQCAQGRLPEVIVPVAPGKLHGQAEQFGKTLGGQKLAFGAIGKNATLAQ